MRTIIGIDPGQSGGIAFKNQDWHNAYSMPQTETDIFLLLRDLQVKYQNIICYIESVHSMPGQGVSSSFKFGKGYGFLRGVLISLGIPFEDITPQKWQKDFVVKKAKNESKTDHKNKLKAKAQQLFPNVKFTLKNCDAMLIAEYGYRNERI